MFQARVRALWSWAKFGKARAARTQPQFDSLQVLVDNSSIAFAILDFLEPIDVALLAKTSSSSRHFYLGLSDPTAILIDRWWIGCVIRLLLSLESISYPDPVPWHPFPGIDVPDLGSRPPKDSPWSECYGVVYKLLSRRQHPAMPSSISGGSLPYEYWESLHTRHPQISAIKARYNCWHFGFDDRYSPHRNINRLDPSDDPPHSHLTDYDIMLRQIHSNGIGCINCSHIPCSRHIIKAIQHHLNPLHNIQFSKLQRDIPTVRQRFVPLLWDDIDPHNFLRYPWDQTPNQHRVLIWLITILTILKSPELKASVCGRTRILSPTEFLDGTIEIAQMLNLFGTKQRHMKFTELVSHLCAQWKSMLQTGHHVKLPPRERKYMKPVFRRKFWFGKLTSYFHSASHLFLDFCGRVSRTPHDVILLEHTSIDRVIRDPLCTDSYIDPRNAGTLPDLMYQTRLFLKRSSVEEMRSLFFRARGIPLDVPSGRKRRRGSNQNRVLSLEPNEMFEFRVDVPAPWNGKQLRLVIDGQYVYQFEYLL